MHFNIFKNKQVARAKTMFMHANHEEIENFPQTIVG